jgi:hypothetical protein
MGVAKSAHSISTLSMCSCMVPPRGSGVVTPSSYFGAYADSSKDVSLHLVIPGLLKR